MKYTVAIITVSDSCSKGQREDLSGPCIKDIVEKQNFEVVSMEVVPDNSFTLQNYFRKHIFNRVNLILTTGGTGFSDKDITPEATQKVITKEAPGIAEAVRAHGMQYSNRSMLSRGICGIIQKSIILNLPGSPKAVSESLEFVLDPLTHAIDILTGNASNCARND